jgi:hypothetical protein
MEVGRTSIRLLDHWRSLNIEAGHVFPGASLPYGKDKSLQLMLDHDGKLGLYDDG